MEPNKESKKPRISYRYYELPEGELVQAITGDDWVCTYGTYAEDVHFHNVMEIGICRWGQGFMVLEDRRIDYTDGAITVVPASCLHTTLSKDKSLNSWEYLFFDPQGMFDRIGRIADETPFVVEWFVRNGIRVWSTQEGEQRFDNHTDKLLNYIRFWQADGESEKLPSVLVPACGSLWKKGTSRVAVRRMVMTL